MVLPHFLQILVYANSCENLLQDFWFFCILFIFNISSTIFTFWNFLIYHLGVRIPVPDKWVFLRSPLTRFDITMSNYFSEFALFCIALYNFHIPSRVTTGGQGGQSTTPDSEKFAKNREKEEGNREKEEKSGRKGKNREGSFTLPLLTDRACYATAYPHLVLVNSSNIMCQT